MRLLYFSLVALGVTVTCEAATSYWRNPLGGLYSASTNWVGGIPGNNDNAVFTNTTNFTINWDESEGVGSASFRGTAAITQDIQTATWSVRDVYSVGAVSGADATIVHRSGTLMLTNGNQTAQLRIGAMGSGTYVLAGGRVVADTLISTNGSSSNLILGSGEVAHQAS